MTKLFLALAVLALSGCATCREYPKTCVAVTAVAMGSLALTVHNSHHPENFQMSTPLIGPPDFTTQPVICTGSNCK